jgi:hypothetical protein
MAVTSVTKVMGMMAATGEVGGSGTTSFKNNNPNLKTISGNFNVALAFLN